MLNAYDTARVTDSFTADFPALKGRVALRRFDPPRLPPAALDLAAYADKLMRWEPRLRADITAQISPSPQRETSLDFLLGGKGRGGFARKIKILDYLLRPAPSLMSLDAAGFGWEPNLYYVTQYPATVGARDLYTKMTGKPPRGRLPDLFLQVVQAQALGHELGHAAQYAVELEREGRHDTGEGKSLRSETLSDIFGAAVALSLYGSRARDTLDIFADTRSDANTPFGQGHAYGTGPFLKHALADRETFGRALTPRASIAYGERLFDTSAHHQGPPL